MVSEFTVHYARTNSYEKVS